MKNNISIRNKKAFFNYEIIETEVCGMVLLGSEVKSVRLGDVNFTDSYCVFIKGELFVRSLNIAVYENSSMDGHIPTRDRKLLLTKHQLRKFEKKYDEKGLTIIPLKIFINEKGLIKLEIGLCRGKKTFDKKDSIKEKDIKRDTDNYLKNYK